MEVVSAGATGSTDGGPAISPQGGAVGDTGSASRPYADVSYWLESCGDALTPRPALDGDRTCDVAILGAGFSGLWTAYYLLQGRPDLRVVLLEREIAGFGASGRNGGFCQGPGLRLHRAAAGGEAEQALYHAQVQTLPEIRRVLEAEAIDAHWHEGGSLTVALGPHHQALLDRDRARLERQPTADGVVALDGAALASRIRMTGAVGAMASPVCATVHPGRLVRGLARAVERRGAVICEQTAVRTVRGGREPVVETDRGTVRAGQVVLAGEAYLASFPPVQRRVIPVYSLIVLTRPLTSAQWDAIGWSGREAVGSYSLSVYYMQRTADGRLMLGGRGAPYHFGSRTKPAWDRHPPTHTALQRRAMRWFPTLRPEDFTHAWGGPIAMPRDQRFAVLHDREQNLLLLGRYTGSGVARSNLLGRTAANLLQGVDSPLTRLPYVGHQTPRWPVEPLRWLGVRYVQDALLRVDHRAERTGRPFTGRTLAERLYGAHY